jgi:DNA-binding response OmpR family regulator
MSQGTEAVLISTIGIDTGKNSLHLVGLDDQGTIVPRTMLLEKVWDLHFDPSTNIIDVYVGRVRRKVDGEQTYPLIHTIRGVGFCVRAPR